MDRPGSRPRRPNRRGEGSRLRAEIVAAASALLEENGNEDAITLRGVARAIGIAAPSIYAHFPDVDAILDAVVADAFEDLDAALVDASAAEGDLLGSVCRAYVSFALERPHRYRVMFGRYRAEPGAPVNRPRPIEELSGATAFQRLVTAVAARAGAGRGRDVGSDRDPDTAETATALWVALHGYASLRASVPAFPWPPEDALLRTLVDRLVPSG